MAARPITVSVRRQDGPDARPRWETHTLSVDPDRTVLSVLEEIRAEHAPDLAFRSACRHGVCGECAVQVQGRPALACVSRVGDHLDWRGRLKIAPLGGMAPIRDLVVDRAPFWAAWHSARPWLEPDGPAPDTERRVSPAQQVAIQGADACVRCGVCWSACPVVRSGSGFAGPQAMLEALGRINDPRDGAADARLAAVSGDQGVWRCHGVLSCMENCPLSLNPADAIFQLRRMRPTGGHSAD